MNNIVDAFNTAMGGIDVAQATSDFFPAPPSTFDEQLILSCVAGVLGLLGGTLLEPDGSGSPFPLADGSFRCAAPGIFDLVAQSRLH